MELNASCNNLALLDQNFLAFNYNSCSIKSLIVQSHFEIFGSVHYENLNAHYENDWILKMKKQAEIFNGGVKGKFKYLDLGSEISSVPSVENFLTYHTSDSLLYAQAKIFWSEGNRAHLNWEDLIVGDWNSRIFAKTFGLGSLWNLNFTTHQIEFFTTFFNSKPLPFRDELYSLRDSTSGMFWKLNYNGNFTKMKWNAVYAGGFFEGNFMGRRSTDSDIKRFLYLPFEVQFNFAFLQMLYGQWSFDAEFLNIALYIPEEKRRFYETLAPNRALEASVLQSLSFSLYNLVYRWWGSASANAFLVGGNYFWNFKFKQVELQPQLKMRLFFVHLEDEIFQKKTTGNLLGGSSQERTFSKNIPLFGGVPEVSVALEWKKLFLKLSASQILPFFLPFIFTNDEENGAPAIDESSEKANKDFKFHSFQDGFSMQMNLGIKF